MLVSSTSLVALVTTLSVFLAVSFKSATAQDYKARFDKCAIILDAVEQNDSLYPLKLIERDSCLIGSVAPDFVARTMSADTIRLSNLKGKVVLLHFWSTGCAPCVNELPALNEIVKKYSSHVVFLSITPNTESELSSFFNKHQFDFVTLPQSDAIRNDVFQLPGILPYTILIDRNRKIKKLWFGSNDEKDVTVKIYSKEIDEALSSN